MMVMEREYEEMKISKANIVSCKDYYHEKMYSLTKQISELKNTPTLVVIQIDDDIASSSYIKGKKKKSLSSSGPDGQTESVQVMRRETTGTWELY